MSLRNLWIGVVSACGIALVVCHPATLTADESLPGCVDNLDIDRYPKLSKTARERLETGLRLHESALSSPDWDEKILQARGLLRRASQASRDCMLPHFHLGRSLYRTRLYDEAAEWLGKAVDEAPDFYEAQTELARVRLVSRDDETALSAANAALAVCSSYRPAHELKVVSLLGLDRYEEAKAFLESLGLPEWKPPAESSEGDASPAGTPETSSEADPAAGEDGPGGDTAVAPPQTRKHREIDSAETRLALFLHQTRSQLEGPGWPTTHTEESKHYRVLTPVSATLASNIASRAELIHEVFRDAFPKIGSSEHKYEIRVHPDARSYLNAGGPPQTVGYYDRLFRRLVMFDDTKDPNRVYEVLQHEAFHQYIDDYLDDAPSWFNEGLAEYYGAFEYEVSGKRERLVPRVSEARLAEIVYWLREERYRREPACPSAQRLMMMSQSSMYERASVHYPQSWALIHFIAHGRAFLEKQFRDASRNSGSDSGFGFAPDKRRKAIDYMATLRAYFKALRKKKNSVEAFHSTFGRHDMERFDREWRWFVYNLSAERR